MLTVDLTGGEVKVFGNRGDVHVFRLKNPAGQIIINPQGTYSVVFDSHLGEKTDVTVDTSELASGILKFPLTIEAGSYKVYLLNPRRTLITIDVELR